MPYNDDNVLKLRKALRKHGFTEASARIDIRGINFDRALRMWDNYPQCMDKYPKQLKKKEWMEKSE